jgi:hypothetical protein
MEQFRSIKSYEEFYEISNLGRVKSYHNCRGKGTIFLKPCLNNSGYMKYVLKKYGRQKNHYIHLLVWDAFGDKPRNGRIIIIDHIDENKLNNNINNLQAIDRRLNIHKSYIHRNWELPQGYYFDKEKNKYRAIININGKVKTIGYYESKDDAHKSYIKKLEEVRKWEEYLDVV